MGKKHDITCDTIIADNKTVVLEKTLCKDIKRAEK
jgi:hypothetical protein